MNKLNFINPTSQRHEHEVRLWLLSSGLVLIGLITGLGITTGMQIHHLYLVKTNKHTLQPRLCNFNGLTTEQHTCLKLEQELKKKLGKIDHYTKSYKNPLKHLKTVCATCHDSVELQSLTINKDRIECSFTATQINQARQLITTLTESSQFKTVKLVALKPLTDKGKKISFTIKGATVFS